MKNLNQYIIEKFRINSKNAKEYTGDLSDPKFYETCSIPEYDDDIDDWLSHDHHSGSLHMGQVKKRKKSNDKNTNWYQFYCYLYFNGPTRKPDVIKALKGDTSSQYAEVFTEMKYYNICSSSKGIWQAEDPRNWKN